MPRPILNTSYTQRTSPDSVYDRPRFVFSNALADISGELLVDIALIELVKVDPDASTIPRITSVYT